MMAKGWATFSFVIVSSAKVIAIKRGTEALELALFKYYFVVYSLRHCSSSINANHNSKDGENANLT